MNPFRYIADAYYAAAERLFGSSETDPVRRRLTQTGGAIAFHNLRADATLHQLTPDENIALLGMISELKRGLSSIIDNTEEAQEMISTARRIGSYEDSEHLIATLANRNGSLTADDFSGSKTDYTQQLEVLCQKIQSLGGRISLEGASQLQKVLGTEEAVLTINMLKDLYSVTRYEEAVTSYIAADTEAFQIVSSLEPALVTVQQLYQEFDPNGTAYNFRYFNEPRFWQQVSTGTLTPDNAEQLFHQEMGLANDIGLKFEPLACDKDLDFYRLGEDHPFVENLRNMVQLSHLFGAEWDYKPERDRFELILSGYEDKATISKVRSQVDALIGKRSALHIEHSGQNTTDFLPPGVQVPNAKYMVLSTDDAKSLIQQTNTLIRRSFEQDAPDEIKRLGELGTAIDRVKNPPETPLIYR